MAKSANLFGVSDNFEDIGDVKGRYSSSWVEESVSIGGDYLDTNATQSVSKNFLGVCVNHRRILIFSLLMLLGVFMILARLFYLQIFKGTEFRALAENNRARIVPIPAERGIIYDRFSRELVQNVPSFSLVIKPRDLPKDADEREMILQRVALMSDASYEQIVDLVRQYESRGYESLVVKENLDHFNALRLFVQNADLRGVAIESGTKRFYPTATTNPGISHLLGYVGKLSIDELKEYEQSGYLSNDEIGKSGLEKEYELPLRGKYGKEKVEVDAAGRKQNILAQEKPAPGDNLYLTLDLDAQTELENIMNKQLKTLRKSRAIGIAMDPRTGGILAMVSLPAFNNNDFSGGIGSDQYQQYLANPDQPLFNRAIGGVYPSGSTVKPVIVVAALEENVITKNTTVNSMGSIHVGQWIFRDWKAGGHGITNAVKAIAWSVNSFFYYIGGGYGNFVGLGAERLVKYFRLFNLGQITGIDIPGERPGFVPSPDWKQATKNEQWYVGDTYNLSIGQGDLLVTPLQVAVWTATVANGGNIVTPHLADSLINEETNSTTAINFPIKKKNIVSDRSIEIAREGMHECVLSGSCQLLKYLPFSSGGKTGTAQWNSNRDPQAWFTSFAPYNNPQIVVSILVEEGKEGSTASMPIARDFLKWWGQKYFK